MLIQYELRIAFAFLHEIADKFFERYPEQRRDAALPFTLKDFAEILKDRMELYSDKARVDKFSLLKKYIPIGLRELSSAEEIMLKNLDAVIDRGIKIDVIRAKTEVMVRASKDMKDAARIVERNICGGRTRGSTSF